MLSVVGTHSILGIGRETVSGVGAVSSRRGEASPEADKAVEHVQFFSQRGGKCRQAGRQFRDTRGTISAITSAMSKRYAATISSAASGRGTRRASSLRAKGDNMTPTTKAATIGSIAPGRDRARRRWPAPPASRATKPKLSEGIDGERIGYPRSARLVADVDLRATPPPPSRPTRRDRQTDGRTTTRSRAKGSVRSRPRRRKVLFPAFCRIDFTAGRRRRGRGRPRAAAGRRAP